MVRRPGRTRRRGISEAEACVRCVHMTVWGDHSISTRLCGVWCDGREATGPEQGQTIKLHFADRHF